MSVCFEKARELGTLILASDAAKRLSDAEAALEESNESLTDYQEAERVFRQFAGQVMDIVRSTVYGTLETEEKNCAACCKSGG